MANEGTAPSYDRLEKAAVELEGAEALALKYRKYSSTRERLWFYENKDAALQAVKNACTEGKAAEAGASEKELDDPEHFSYAYKTLRLGTRFALLYIKNYNARAEYISDMAKWSNGYKNALATNGKLAAERAAATRNMLREAFIARTSASNKFFDSLLKQKGHDFGGILEYAREKRYPSKTFKQLSEGERAGVFAEIVESAGKSNKLHDYIFKAEGAVGWALIIATLGVLVYDTVQSSVDYVTKIVNVLGDGAEFAIAWAGAAAAEALAASYFGEAATFTVMFFGVVGGIIAGIAASALISGLTALLSMLFTSTSDRLWKEYLSEPLVYQVKLPGIHLDI